MIGKSFMTSGAASHWRRLVGSQLTVSTTVKIRGQEKMKVQGKRKHSNENCMEKEAFFFCESAALLTTILHDDILIIFFNTFFTSNHVLLFY